MADKRPHMGGPAPNNNEDRYRLTEGSELRGQPSPSSLERLRNHHLIGSGLHPSTWQQRHTSNLSGSSQEHFHQSSYIPGAYETPLPQTLPDQTQPSTPQYQVPHRHAPVDTRFAPRPPARPSHFTGSYEAPRPPTFPYQDQPFPHPNPSDARGFPPQPLAGPSHLGGRSGDASHPPTFPYQDQPFTYQNPSDASSLPSAPAPSDNRFAAQQIFEQQNTGEERPSKRRKRDQSEAGLSHSTTYELRGQCEAELTLEPNSLEALTQKYNKLQKRLKEHSTLLTDLFKSPTQNKDLLRHLTSRFEEQVQKEKTISQAIITHLNNNIARKEGETTTKEKEISQIDEQEENQHNKLQMLKQQYQYEHRQGNLQAGIIYEYIKDANTKLNDIQQKKTRAISELDTQKKSANPKILADKEQITNLQNASLLLEIQTKTYRKTLDPTHPSPTGTASLLQATDSPFPLNVDAGNETHPQQPSLPPLEHEPYFNQLVEVRGNHNQCAIEAITVAQGTLPWNTSFNETVAAIEQELGQEHIRDKGNMINLGDMDGIAMMNYLRGTKFLDSDRPIDVYSRHPQTGELRRTRIGDESGDPYSVFYDHEALHYWGLQGPLTIPSQDRSASYYLLDRSPASNPQNHTTGFKNYSTTLPPSEATQPDARKRANAKSNAKQSEALKLAKEGKSLTKEQQSMVDANAKSNAKSNAKQSEALKLAKEGKPLTKEQKSMVDAKKRASAKSNAKRSEALKLAKEGKPLTKEQKSMVDASAKSNAKQSEALKLAKEGKSLTKEQQSMVDAKKRASAKRLKSSKLAEDEDNDTTSEDED